MNGCIIANTPIAVDFWRVSGDSPHYVHFLSHMHSDHTSGLSSSWRRPIYCSEITSRLLKAKLQVKESLIHCLPLGQAVIIPLAHDNEETMTVTLIDANHCPGAVMFLFEGYFGKILYTGDFKYSSSMFSEDGLQDFPDIDVLYLDNTFNSKECVWPSQQEAAEMIEGIIATLISDTNVFIALHNLGKEELLVRIAKKFQRWITVSPARYETLKLLEMPNVFTTDMEASNISVISQAEVTWKNLINWNSAGTRTVVIVPSALYKLSKVRKAYSHPNVCLVPYSSHCSYSELIAFVSKVRPKKIVPIVKEGGSNCDVSNFDCFLSKHEQLPYRTPECVKLFQINGSFPRIELRKVNQHIKARTAKRKVPSGVVFEDLTEVTSENHDKTTNIAAEETDFSSKVGESNTLNPRANGSSEQPMQNHQIKEFEPMASVNGGHSVLASQEGDLNSSSALLSPEERHSDNITVIGCMQEREASSTQESQEGERNSSSSQPNQHERHSDQTTEIGCKKEKTTCDKHLHAKQLNGISLLKSRKKKLRYKTPDVKMIAIPVKQETSFYQVFVKTMAKMIKHK